MFFVLVLVAGAVLAEAGITHVPNGFSLHQPRSHFVRPSVRTQFANPIGPSQIKLVPVLSHGPVFTNTFVSPTLFKSALYSNNVPKFRPLPITHGLRPTSTISHISPPVVRNSLELNSFVSAPLLNSLPISHVIRPVTITKQQIPTTLINSTPTEQVANGPSLINTQNTLNSISTSETVREVQEIPKKTVSYSLSEQDYLYLKRHKVEGQDSPYNPEFANSTPIQLKNPHTHHGQDKDASSPQPPSHSDLLKRSAVPNQKYSAYVEPSIANTPAPIVVKHIYFHVPQPEFEEPPPVVNLLPPKKTYNILFIKAPTHESQNHAYLQQLQQPQIEDKTLIYVLSKKQDPEVVVPPQETRSSSPEVYFVKYQTKFEDVDPRNTGSVVEESVLENISPVLNRKRSVEKKPSCKTETKTVI